MNRKKIRDKQKHINNWLTDAVWDEDDIKSLKIWTEDD